MKFLKEIGYSENEINELENVLDFNILEKIKSFPVLVLENIKYLKDLGIRNYKEIFNGYASIFLKDASVFEAIFSKYDVEDLIEKIESNPGIIEYL